MIRGIDHIGIAVRSLEEGIAYYESVLGLRCERREVIPSHAVRVAVFAVGDTHLELLEPTRSDTALARILETKGEGIHHIAFATDALDEELAQVRAAGVRLIQEQPVAGAGGKRIAFLHPNSTHGVLTEFCEMGAPAAEDGHG